MPISVIVLGAGGSVGRQVLSVLDNYRSLFNYELLTLDDDINFNNAFLSKHKVNKVFFYNNHKHYSFKNIKIINSFQEVLSILDNFSGIVVNALPGLIGYEATKHLLKSNIILLQANKEALVLDGKNIMESIKRNRQTIIPLDSEMQALRELINFNLPNIKNYIITASGGALRNLDINSYLASTKANILNHPTWKMGAEITVNSATLTNKIFEIIEAHHLFGIPYDQIKVLVNKQSIIHAGIQTNTNSFYFNSYLPTMLQSINLGIAEALETTAVAIDNNLLLNNLNFDNSLLEHFPLYQLGLKIISLNNQDLITLYYLTNQYLVELFLEDKITFKILNTVFLDLFKEKKINSLIKKLPKCKTIYDKRDLIIKEILYYFNKETK